MTRHSVQTDMLGLVTDTHRADAGQPTLEDALECHAARTGEGYWTCDVPGGCPDCRALAAEIGDTEAWQR